MLRASFCLFIILSASFSLIAGETGCPPPEDVFPYCKCYKQPNPRLMCHNILNNEYLLGVFRVSERYTFQEVHIADSAFTYIPPEIFQKSFIKELYIENSTFSRLFNGPVFGSKHLYKIQLNNTKIQNTFTSADLSSFSMLNELIVGDSPVRRIPSQYSNSLPKGLKKISFYANGLQKIASGAFSLIPNLEKFVVENNRLTYLKRDVFPTPFNVRSLNFDSNRIGAIPDDMFQEMPNLQFLSMKNNLIASIPESAFHGRLRNVPYFRFDGNPLQCDCNILWIVKDKPEILGGKCIYPAKFNGRELKDLKKVEFSC